MEEKEQAKKVNSNKEVGDKTRDSLTKGKYKLDDLLEKVTEENKHEEIDFGKPQGEELL